MASLMIHQVIAEKFIEKHPNVVKNIGYFYHGNIAPDEVSNKKYTHYSTLLRNQSFSESVENKVNLTEFCAHNDIATDFS